LPDTKKYCFLFLVSGGLVNTSDQPVEHAYVSINQSINQSIFIIKCDKRTQNNADFSENDSAEKHNKTHKHKYTGSDINWNELYSNSLNKLI